MKTIETVSQLNDLLRHYAECEKDKEVVIKIVNIDDIYEALNSLLVIRQKYLDLKSKNII